MYNKLKNKKAQLILIFSSWLLLHLLLFFVIGIRPILESIKYIRAAELLLSKGILPGIRYNFYLTTTLLIAFSLKIGVGFKLVVLIQSLLSLFAIFRFYIALQRNQTNCYSAFFTTIALLCCIPFFAWNFYLYTESLFYSFSLLFFSYCVGSEFLTPKKVLAQFILLALTVISRPLGVLFIPCWIIYLIGKTDGKIKLTLYVSFAAGCVAVILISNLVLGNIMDWHVLKPAEHGFIICELPTHPKINLDELKNRSPLSQLFLYVLQNPFNFLSLAIHRILHFFLQVRPYYSFIHNAFLCLMNGLLYAPIILYTINFKKNKKRNHALFSASIIIIFMSSVALQCDDYHSRFHNTIIPVFLYCGLYKLLNSYRVGTKTEFA